MKNEYMFYLSMVLYERYLKEDYVLLDLYYDKICKIYEDYLKYDNKNKSLLDSINDYIEERKDFILELLNECIEDIPKF